MTWGYKPTLIMGVMGLYSFCRVLTSISGVFYPTDITGRGPSKVHVSTRSTEKRPAPPSSKATFPEGFGETKKSHPIHTHVLIGGFSLN